MSRNEPLTSSVEFLSTLEARRTTISMIGVLTGLGSLFILVTQYALFPPGQAYATMLQIPVIALIFLFRKSDLSAWIGIASMIIAALGTTFTDPTSDARISASTTLFIALYCGVVMLRGWKQFVWLAAVALIWAQIVPVVDLPFRFIDRDINLRWATALQLLIAGLWTMLVWNREFEDLLNRDRTAAETAERRASAIATSERMRVWRESLVRVHETVLNDIRSVLDSERIDGERLTRQLRSSETFTAPQSSRTSLQELIRPLNVMQSEQRLIIGKLPDVQLRSSRATALRSALLEVMRNAYRHSGVTTLRVDALADRNVVQISLASDSGMVVIPDEAAGIGTGVVLREALTSLGATLTQERGVLTVHVPRGDDAEASSTMSATYSGRTLLSAIGAGNALGGGVFYVAVATQYGWQGIAMALCGFVTAVMSVWAIWRRRNVGPALLVPVTLIATAVPVLAIMALGTCSSVEIPLIVTALTSLGFYSIIVWAPRVRWWVLGIPFALALTLLSEDAMTACTSAVAPVLLSAFSAPLLMSLTVVTNRLALHRNSQLQRMQLAALRDAAAAEAAEQLSTDLYAAVTTARDVLSDIAHSESLTSDQRLQLRCIDSEIRATIQVDPETSGGMSLAARSAIHRAAAELVPTRVLVLRDSGDRRELPPPVVSTLNRLLLAAIDGSASIQILSNTFEDVLTLTVSEATRRAAGLPDDWMHEFETGVATLDSGSEHENALLLVQRRLPTPAPDSSAHQVPALSPSQSAHQ